MELNSQSGFSRMCEYGFSDKMDYSEVIVKNDENSKGGRPATDYGITVDIYSLRVYGKIPHTLILLRIPL